MFVIVGKSVIGIEPRQMKVKVVIHIWESTYIHITGGDASILNHQFASDSIIELVKVN